MDDKPSWIHVCEHFISEMKGSGVNLEVDVIMKDWKLPMLLLPTNLQVLFVLVSKQQWKAWHSCSSDLPIPKI
jgi:hypothetical protein